MSVVKEEKIILNDNDSHSHVIRKSIFVLIIVFVIAFLGSGSFGIALYFGLASGGINYLITPIGKGNGKNKGCRSIQDISLDIPFQENIKPKITFNAKAKEVFTNEERKLYFQLRKYLENKKVILLSKVRLADFVGTQDFSLLNKINRKYVDFLISDYNGKIIALIELDGRSHNSKKMQESDKLKNDLFSSLDLPLIRFENYQYHNFHLLDPYLQADSGKL